MKYVYTYSMMDMLLSNPVQPTPVARRIYQLTRMYEGLAALERDANPSLDDCKVVSDAMNLMETLVKMGWAKDPDKLVQMAIKSLEKALERAVEKNVPIRLDGEGIQLIRGLLEDYSAALEELPERTIIQCHRDTEKRIQDIHHGKIQPHDRHVSKGVH